MQTASPATPRSATSPSTTKTAKYGCCFATDLPARDRGIRPASRVRNTFESPTPRHGGSTRGASASVGSTAALPEFGLAGPVHAKACAAVGVTCARCRCASARVGADVRRIACEPHATGPAIRTGRFAQARRHVANIAPAAGGVRAARDAVARTSVSAAGIRVRTADLSGHAVRLKVARVHAVAGSGAGIEIGYACLTGGTVHGGAAHIRPTVAGASVHVGGPCSGAAADEAQHTSEE